MRYRNCKRCDYSKSKKCFHNDCPCDKRNHDIDSMQNIEMSLYIETKSELVEEQGDEYFGNPVYMGMQLDGEFGNQ